MPCVFCASIDVAAERNPDSSLWASRAVNNARRALARLGDELFDAVLAHFSDAWFERRTWQEQALAFANLHTTWQREPSAALYRLVLAFGEPDIINPDF